MTTRGIRNCNPLNIRIGNPKKGLREKNTDGSFEQFINIYWGYRAAFVLLKEYINKHKCNTVEKIIRRFPSSSENNTERYIKTVCELTGWKRDRRVKADYYDLSILVYAMAWVESMSTPTSNMLLLSWLLI